MFFLSLSMGTAVTYYSGSGFDIYQDRFQVFIMLGISPSYLYQQSGRISPLKAESQLWKSPFSKLLEPYNPGPLLAALSKGGCSYFLKLLSFLCQGFSFSFHSPLAILLVGPILYIWFFMLTSHWCCFFLDCTLADIALWVGWWLFLWVWEMAGTTEQALKWNQKRLTFLFLILHFPTETFWPKHLASFRLQLAYVWNGINI